MSPLFSRALIHEGLLFFRRPFPSSRFSLLDVLRRSSTGGIFLLPRNLSRHRRARVESHLQRTGCLFKNRSSGAGSRASEPDKKRAASRDAAQQKNKTRATTFAFKHLLLHFFPEGRLALDVAPNVIEATFPAKNVLQVHEGKQRTTRNYQAIYSSRKRSIPRCVTYIDVPGVSSNDISSLDNTKASSDRLNIRRLLLSFCVCRESGNS